MKNETKQIKDEIKKLLKRASQSNESAKKVSAVCNLINNSWSGSDLVGHVNFFYGDFNTPPHESRFSVEWGLINGIPKGWNEKKKEEVIRKIETDANILLKNLNKDADFIEDEFGKLRKQTIVLFLGVSKEAATEIEKFNIHTKTDIFNQYWERQIMTRDSQAIYAGRQVPTHKYYEATASFITGVAEQLNEFLYLIDKVVARNKGMGQKMQKEGVGMTAYVDKNTLLRLNKIESENFDLSRLIAFCNELDDNYSLENYHSCAMLLRAILDHISPVFNKKSFGDVCAQHGGKSFKDIIEPLNKTAKKIGDDYLHTQISKKVLATTKIQVSFQANLDTLLNEVAAILEQK